eukprot:TRINITY_DN64911_c0_g1_i1.p2 TRINITY_DN64911_c0_g1~~TRINITY_DN64911_c0_g1_i1.p2  ORF type:complete len:283 (+),score=95.61 TRINITY_DN64911_c0_g1_i1:89-850(+)
MGCNQSADKPAQRSAPPPAAKAPAAPPARPKVHGLPISPNQIPIMALLQEMGIAYDDVKCDLMQGDHLKPEFIARNPMHCIPSLEHGDLFMWESCSVMRYICNIWPGGQRWYPTDPKARAVCDMMLDWRQTALAPVLGPVLLYPRAGFVPPIAPEDEEKGIQRFNKDLWPTMQHVIKLNGGRFLGGAHPNIADLAVLGYMQALLWRDPECPIFETPGVKAYVESATGALSKWKEATAVAAQVWPTLGRADGEK